MSNSTTNEFAVGNRSADVISMMVTACAHKGIPHGLEYAESKDCLYISVQKDVGNSH